MERNIRLLWLYTIIMNGLFMIPVLVPYYEAQIGLTFQDFLIGEAFFALVVVLLEDPSGWLSDIWNRKRVLFLAMVFELAAVTALLLADSLLDAVIAQGLFGVSISLVSGTNMALLYDSLIVLNRTDDYTRLAGRQQGFGLYAVGAASLVGGGLYAFDPYAPLYLQMMTVFGGMICSAFMIEPPRSKRAAEKHPLADMLETMKYALHGHIEIGLIIVFSAMLFSSTKLIMWMQQPYYMAMEIPEVWFGVLMTVGYSLGGFSSHISHWMERHISNARAIALAWGMALAVCVGAAVHLGVHGIILLMFGGSCIFKAAFPRVNAAINKRVGSERRATVLSTASLLREVVFIPLSLLVGWMATSFGVQSGLFGIAAWLICGSTLLVIWVLRRRYRLNAS